MPISNTQRVDDVSVPDVYLTDYFADRPASFARDTPASRLTAGIGTLGTRTLDTQYTRISNVRTAGTDSNVCVTSTAAAAHTRVPATPAATATMLEHQRGPDPALASRTDPLTAARPRIVTHRREHDYRFEPIHYAADRSPLYDRFVDVRPRAQRTPPPSVASGVSTALDSDADSDYPEPAQRVRRPPSRLSAASGRPASVASHHSDAVQLASKLADALQDQLKQACERQQRLDKERQDEHARAEKERIRIEAERAAAYDREQRDRLAMLDREDRQRERERSDLLELADQRARAAALEQQLQHLQDTAAQLPAPPSITTSAPGTSTQPDTPPVVTVAQLVDTSVPSTPLSTHPGLHSLTGITTFAATYPARSALQRAADIYDQLAFTVWLTRYTCLGTTQCAHDAFCTD